MKNQCDGCAQGLPIELGLHKRNDGWVFMACTKDRYKGIDPNVFLMMYDHWIRGKNRTHDSSIFRLFINEWRYTK